jgi:hypothetical protein
MTPTLTAYIKDLGKNSANPITAFLRCISDSFATAASQDY